MAAILNELKKWVVLSTVIVAACQSTQDAQNNQPTVTVSDAKKLAFENTSKTTFEAPTRSIIDIQETIGDVEIASYECEDRWKDDRMFLRQRIDSYADLKNLFYYIRIIGNEFGRWDAQEILANLDTAGTKTSRTWIKGAFLAQKTRYQAWMGDLENAKKSLEGTEDILTSFSARNSLSKETEAFTKAILTIYRDIANAGLSSATGDLVGAEALLRRANAVRSSHIRSNGDPSGRFWLRTEIGSGGVRGDLARNLVLQGRLVEAEAIARDLFWQYRKEVSPANIGEILSLLATILYEQERFDEARWSAETALKLHAKDCSLPTSLAVIDARLTAARVAAAQKRWEDALDQYRKILDSAKGKAWIERRLDRELLWPLTLLQVRDSNRRTPSSSGPRPSPRLPRTRNSRSRVFGASRAWVPATRP